jgi:ADP-ribosylglycohydrolase
VAELRHRYLELREAIVREDRLGDPRWQALERDVIDADEAIEPVGEPWALEAIRAARPDRRLGRCDGVPAGDELADRVRGAWYGRIAGCVLGKPVEAFLAEPGRYWERLRDHLVKYDAYPPTDYIRESTIVPYWEYLREQNIAPHWFAVEPNWASLRERIAYAPTDDDIRNTIVALRKVQRLGRQFAPDESLLFTTAELRNTASLHRRAPLRNLALGMSYPRAARFMATGRERLLPQISCDLYGFICPGDAEAAAELAWRESAGYASENGLYGGMWIAAAIASAFVESDVEQLLRRGIEQIPATSRLARELLATLEAAERHGDDFDATMADVVRRTGHLHCIDAINNCCIIAAAVMHGGGDYTRTIGLAVAGGFDTDCNGANAGSIAGVLNGRRNIPEPWLAPLNDTVHTMLPGIGPMRISDLAAQTLALI